MSPARLLLMLSALSAATLLGACSSGPEQALSTLQATRGQARSTQDSSAQLAQDGAITIAANDFSSKESMVALARQQNLALSAAFTPYQGSTARIYGSTALGCIAGSVEVRESPDLKFQVWGRGRNFAHPIMAQYLNDLRTKIKAQGLPPLVVGDIALKYGGPYGPKSNHASHNTGLDVDLPFFFAPRGQSVAHHPDVYIVKGQKVLPTFTPEITRLIISAASDPRVDRVFVAPMIKQRMCQLYEAQPHNGFLHKLRPWFGHQAHMHVRLKCPSDSPQCLSQSPIPEGTGCGYEVQSWFMPPPPKSPSKLTQSQAKPKPKPELPEQCKILWRTR